MRRASPIAVVLAVVAGSLAARLVAAQDTTVVIPPAAPTPAGAPRCSGEIITAVSIDRAEPVMVERSVGWSRPFLRFALAGEPTRESAIAPFLLIRPGGPCTELLLRESERVLRAQPYLADARASVTPDGAGGVQVRVATVDDLRSILGLSVKDGGPSRFKLGSGNISGYGMAAMAQWRQGFAYRDGFGASFTDYHVFGYPVQFHTEYERAPLGQLATVSLSRPLYSQVQRVAWSGSVARVDRYQEFLRGADEDVLSLDTERRSWQLNAVYRVGGGSLGVFAGAQLAGDELTPAERGVIITDTGFVADTDTVLTNRYARTSRSVAAVIVGARALSFFKAEGFDALEGAQDVANGVQIATLLGRGIGSGPGGWFLGTTAYAGAGTPRSFVGMQASVETGREEDAWSDVIGAGRLAWYSRPSRRRTRIASLEYSGTWRTSVPFQLRLGLDRAGVRGYDDSRTTGGRRAVMRLEERLTFPGISRYLGFGGAGFLDVGKMWAGDVPFGETVNPRVGAGVGLIVAVPRTSRRNLRLDVAAPLVSDAGSGWGVNVTITSGRPRFWREPSDLARARSAAQTPVVFGWP